MCTGEICEDINEFFVSRDLHVGVEWVGLRVFMFWV